MAWSHAQQKVEEPNHERPWSEHQQDDSALFKHIYNNFDNSYMVHVQLIMCSLVFDIETHMFHRILPISGRLQISTPMGEVLAVQGDTSLIEVNSLLGTASQMSQPGWFICDCHNFCGCPLVNMPNKEHMFEPLFLVGAPTFPSALEGKSMTYLSEGYHMVPQQWM